MGTPAIDQKPIQAGIYCRISEDTKGDMLGVKRQEKAARALADQKNWTVKKVYVDDDRSAWNGKPRPAYQEMLADLRDGAINAVVVYDLDRLHRLPIELEQFFNVCDAVGVQNLASVGGDVNLATSDGRLYARMMGAIAKKSSDDTSRRLKSKLAELAEAGKPHGRQAYGFKADRVTIDEAESAVIREITERFLANETLHSIAQSLNKRNLPSPRNTKHGWCRQTVQALLVSPRVAGLRQHQGKVIGKAEWEAIISPATRERILGKLNDPTRRLKNPTKRRLLSGLVFCGLCNEKLVYTGALNQLRCDKQVGRPGCGGVYIQADAVERYIVIKLLEVIEQGQIQEANGVTEEVEDAVMQEIGKLEARKVELADMFAVGEIDRPSYFRVGLTIDKKIDEQRGLLIAAAGPAVVKSLFVGGTDEWEAMPLDSQRNILNRFIDRITITAKIKESGRPKVDLKRVKINWAR